MASSDRASDVESTAVVISVQNIGGIDECEVTFEPGVSVLTGRNATNRTSLLSALGGVLGGTTASLKSDADQGHVRLEMNGSVFTRELERTTDGTRTGGSPYVEDATLVDHFVTLLEDNPVRRAVERGDPLRDVVMRPVDTDAIEARIRELTAERRAVEDEIEAVEDRRADLPALEDQRQSLEAAIESLDEELADCREAVDSMEADAADVEAAAEVLESLNQRRQELSHLEDELEVKRSERDALLEERRALEEEYDELTDQFGDDREAVERELATARERKRELDETVASLTAIVEFNEDLLAEADELARIESDEPDVPAGLAPDDERTVVCWTCGSEVEGRTIHDRLDDLRAVVQEKREAARALDDRIDELQARLEEFEQRRTRRSDVERRLEETAEKLADVDADIEALVAEVETARSAVADLEEEVARTEALRESDLLETYERIADLQYELGQRQEQLQAVEAEREEIQSLPDPETLEAQREEIVAELEQEHARIDQLETAAIDAFNEHMDELLDLLGYENIARIWLERKTAGDTAGPAGADSSFDLHVVRTSTEGSGYEDELANLSESEREVVGLVVALAGYLVHQVADRVPFMVLDSLEAIDADRIADVVSYFSTSTPYLVVALLPEDARALDESYDRIPADVLSG